MALSHKGDVYSSRSVANSRRAAGRESVSVLGQGRGAGRSILAGCHALRQAYNTQRILRSQIQTLKLNYYPETDSLYIDLSSKPSAESQEVSEGVMLDYDAEGNLVGIDIDNASRKLDLRELVHQV